MAVKVYNKLVRDKIPEIIEADGRSCKTEILSKEEYLKWWMPSWMKSWQSITRIRT